MSTDDPLRYPIGKFVPRPSYSPEEVKDNIARIAALPAKVEKVWEGFSPAHLDVPYRDGGWTARQVLHHLPDSHLNAYIRFKWTLTEDTPLIKAYDEKSWAETAEISADPALSVHLLKALHSKWVVLLRSLNSAELGREFIHPETQKRVPLDRMIALYAWHGEHHLGHLQIIAKK